MNWWWIMIQCMTYGFCYEFISRNLHVFVGLWMIATKCTISQLDQELNVYLFASKNILLLAIEKKAKCYMVIIKLSQWVTLQELFILCQIKLAFEQHMKIIVIILCKSLQGMEFWREKITMLTQ